MHLNAMLQIAAYCVLIALSLMPWLRTWRDRRRWGEPPDARRAPGTWR